MKTSQRHDVIEELVEAGIEGMHRASLELHAENDEVVSAYFTLLRRGLAAALQISNDKKRTRAAFRGSLFTLLADVAEPTLN